METRKGRLIPDVKPLDYFYEEGSRSPFDGEIKVFEAELPSDMQAVIDGLK